LGQELKEKNYKIFFFYSGNFYYVYLCFFVTQPHLFEGLCTLSRCIDGHISISSDNTTVRVAADKSAISEIKDICRRTLSVSQSSAVTSMADSVASAPEETKMEANTVQVQVSSMASQTCALESLTPDTFYSKVRPLAIFNKLFGTFPLSNLMQRDGKKVTHK